MTSSALAAALADLDTVFNGFASPGETGCERCFGPAETAFPRTPYTRVPGELVSRFVFKDPAHFEDHAAVLRRLLPRTARDGGGRPGRDRLGRARAEPDRLAFLVGRPGCRYRGLPPRWWQDALAKPESPYGIQDVFETCATIARSVTPFLDGWAQGPVADAHFVHCADHWLYHLLSDSSPFTWWYDDTEDTGVADLRTW